MPEAELKVENSELSTEEKIRVEVEFHSIVVVLKSDSANLLLSSFNM